MNRAEIVIVVYYLLVNMVKSFYDNVKLIDI